MKYNANDIYRYGKTKNQEQQLKEDLNCNARTLYEGKELPDGTIARYCERCNKLVRSLYSLRNPTKIYCSAKCAFNITKKYM